MKARLPLLAAAALSILSFAPAQAVTTWTYTPSSASDTGAKTIGGVTITPTYTWQSAEGFGANLSSGMLQIGKANANATKIEYEFTAFANAVRKVTFSGKTAAGNNGQVDFSAAVGTSNFAVSGVLTNNESSVVLTAPESPQSGSLSLELSNPRADAAPTSSQAIYLKSIVIELNEAPTSNWSSTEEVNATVNATTTVDLSSAFTDADGDSLSYSANVASVSFSGHSLQFIPSQEGDTTIVVTAADPYGATASVSILVHATVASVPAPMLVVANTSWTAGVAGTSAVSATLEGDVACTVASVTMSDGSTATVANGTLSWTPPAANTASSVTATFHVTHGMDGWDLPQVLSVAATPAPSAPIINLSNASRRSFDASWSAATGGPVVEYKVRAWTGRATPDDATGSASESFSTYRTGGPLPADWSPSASFSIAYASDQAPVKFDKNISLDSPVYLGNITSLSFVVKRNGTTSGSTFSVYGSSGEDGAVFSLIESFDASTFANTDAGTTLTPTVPSGIHQFKFSYEKASGNVGFGTFSVSGTDWPAADFLEGWGGAKVSVGTDTSRTFSNPVSGTANYVEVTAIGPTGLSSSTIESISVPRAPAGVISVK